MKEAEKMFIIENEMKKYKPLLSKAADLIIEKEGTHYPIFVVHKQEIALGVPLIDRIKMNVNWSVNASSLEEFVNKDLVFENKKEAFINAYKDPKTHICLFI